MYCSLPKLVAANLMVKLEGLKPLPEKDATPPDGSAPRKPGESRLKVVCLTCGKPGLYAAKGPNNVPAWLCSAYPGCDSYVGCEKGTERALGSPAGPEVRAARVAAHRWIDRLWRNKTFPTRKEVYQLVSQALGVRNFHIARADMNAIKRLETRRQAIERAFEHVPDDLHSSGGTNLERRHQLNG